MLSRSTQLVFMNYLGARPIYANSGTLPFFLSLSLSSLAPRSLCSLFISRRARLRCKECICINEAGRYTRATRCERALTVQPRHVREFTSALYLPLSRYSHTRFSSYWLHREASSPSPFVSLGPAFGPFARTKPCAYPSCPHDHDAINNLTYNFYAARALLETPSRRERSHRPRCAKIDREAVSRTRLNIYRDRVRR